MGPTRVYSSGYSWRLVARFAGMNTSFFGRLLDQVRLADIARPVLDDPMFHFPPDPAKHPGMAGHNVVVGVVEAILAAERPDLRSPRLVRGDYQSEVGDPLKGHPYGVLHVDRLMRAALVENEHGELHPDYEAMDGWSIDDGGPYAPLDEFGLDAIRSSDETLRSLLRRRPKLGVDGCLLVRNLDDGAGEDETFGVVTFRDLMTAPGACLCWTAAVTDLERAMLRFTHLHPGPTFSALTNERRMKVIESVLADRRRLVAVHMTRLEQYERGAGEPALMAMLWTFVDNMQFADRAKAVRKLRPKLFGSGRAGKRLLEDVQNLRNWLAHPTIGVEPPVADLAALAGLLDATARLAAALDAEAERAG